MEVNGYLGFLKRIDRLIDNNQLIGIELYKILHDAAIIERIHEEMNKAKKYIANGKETAEERKLLLISLSLIALTKYDSNFWNHVRKIYRFDKDYSIIVSPQVLERNIRHILAMFGNDLPSDSRKINVALCNALVPIHYLDDFYKIMLDIFLHDFKTTLPEDDIELDEVLTNIFTQIASKEYSDGDLFTSTALNQSYKLIKSTRDVINESKHRTVFARFARHVIKSIESQLFPDTSKSDEISYLNSYSKEWYEMHGKKKHEIYISNNQIRKSRLRWKPELALKIEFDFSLYLYTKTIFIPNDVNYKDVKVKIFSNEELVYSNEKPEIIDNAMSTELSSIEVLLDWEPFKMHYINEGLSLEQVLFQNPYLVFNENGVLVQSNYHNHENLYILYKTSITQTNTQLIVLKPHYKVGYINTYANSYLNIDGNILPFQEIIEPQIIGNTHKYSFVIHNNKELKIYNESPKLMIPKDDKINKFIINLNGAYSKHRGDQNCVSLDLEAGINHIELTVYKEDEFNRKSFIVIYDPKLNIDTVKKNDDLYQVTIQSSNHDIAGTYKYSPNLEEFFSVSTDKYILCVELSIPMIKKSEAKYELVNDYLWHSDYNYYNLVKFKGIFADEMRIVDSKYGRVLNKYDSRDDGKSVTFDFDIGILKSKDRNFSIQFFKNAELIYSVEFLNFNIVNKNDVSINYDPLSDSLSFKLDNSKGKSRLHFRLYFNDDLACEEEISNFPYVLTLTTFQSFAHYLVAIFDVDRQIELYKYVPFIIKKADLVGKELVIKDIFTDISIKTDKKFNYHSKNPFIYNLKGHYLLVKEYDSTNNYFIGSVFVEDRYGLKFFFRKLKEVHVEIDENLKLDEFNANIFTLDQEELFFDPKSKKIIDNAEADPYLKSIGTIYDYTLKVR